MTSRRQSLPQTGLNRIAEYAKERARPVIADEVRAMVAAEVDKRLAAATGDDLQFTLRTLISGRGGSNRVLSQKLWSSLVKQVQGMTGAKDAEVQFRLSQAYLSLLDAESRGLGRIAGWTYNILGKLVVPPLLAPPEGPILEIGTLYGLFSPTLVRSFRRTGEFRHLTIIDPLVGDQQQGGKSLPDDASGTPVVQEVVERNFAELGLRPDEFRTIAGFSTDDAVRAQAADRKYSVVVVDGDHYEDGVLKDLQWVETILAPGGIAVMDDYGDKRWTGVETATKRYLADGGKMEFLGAVSTSGYLRLPQ